MTTNDDEIRAEILDNETDMLLAGTADVVRETVPLSPAELAELDTLAESLGVTREALLRHAMTEYLKHRS